MPLNNFFLDLLQEINFLLFKKTLEAVLRRFRKDANVKNFDYNTVRYFIVLFYRNMSVPSSIRLGFVSNTVDALYNE